MKTQISNLRSGTKNQVLNSKVNYTDLKKATSHIGHNGSNREDVFMTWQKVVNENKDNLTIEILGKTLVLKANYSLSKKSVYYSCEIEKEFLENNFFIKPSKNKIPYMTISDANSIIVSNGKNSYKTICPSLITIL